MPRDDFDASTIRTLAARAGARCSNPGCRKHTSGPQEDPARAVNIGVAAHITAAAPGGPRYDPELSPEQRRSIENAIWLCQSCSGLIDKDAQRYTVALLREWKRAAEEEARYELEHRMPRDAAIAQPPPIPLQRPPRAAHFTGRADELRRLIDQLQPGAVVTLCGPGGVGKTALAAEAIWTLAPGDEPPGRFPDGVLFHTFYHQPQAALALEAVARAYGEEPRPTPQDAARRALSGRAALLVLDGAEAADDLGAVLSVAGGCGVLITSRRHGDAPACWQDVAPLPNPEAVELLQAWAGARAADQAAAGRICTLVGALPLAVRLAGRYMAQRGEAAADYLAWLEETGLAALHFGERPRDSVPLLLERSVAGVSGAARETLRAVGVLALAPFDRPVISTALEMPVPATGRALGELVDYGLLLRDEAGRYQVSHALVHTYARERLPAPDEACGRLVAYYETWASEQSGQGREGFRRLDKERGHIMRLQAECVERQDWQGARRLAWAMDDYLFVGGYATEWQQIAGAALAAARALGDRRDEGAFLTKLGLAAYGLGQVAQAIGYYEGALEIARDIKHRQDEGIALGNLGIAYADLGEPRRAIEYYEQALRIARAIGDRRGEGADLGSLGLAYADLGEPRRAIEYYEQALVISREIGDRRGEGADLGNLGLAYADLGEPRRAIEYYGQALVIARDIGDRRNEGIHLGNLGIAYKTLGEPRRAIEYCEQALRIAREIGDRRGEAKHSWNLGLLCEESDPARAVALMSVCVAFEREIGHPDADADAERVARIQARLP